MNIIYTIIGGVNGAGKSSLTGVLKAEKNDFGIIIDVDKIIVSHNNNKILGSKRAVKLIDDCLQKGVSFTQETTLSGIKTLRTIKKALEKGYFIRLYYVCLNSVNENILRIDNRVKKGGHTIPKEDVLRRFDSRFSNLKKILPYCHEAIFFDNENGFLEVAQYKNGELTLKDNRSPKWILEFKDFLESDF